jgi:hypothetical protein
MAFTAIYDACVLYPAPLRDLLIRLGRTGLFRAHWTDRIHDEWMRSVMANRPELDVQHLHRTRHLMNQAIPDVLVTGYEVIEPCLALPDVDDRHVLAAAICCRADVIVTYNLKDFPADALKPFGVEAQHPDEFVHHLFHLHQAAVCATVKAQRESLKNPPVSARELLDTFLVQRLPGTVAALETMIDLL